MKKIGIQWFLLIFFLIFLYYKVIPFSNYQFGGVAGDFFSVVNPPNSIISNSFAFRSNLNNGYADNTANMISHNSPYLLYELILSKLGISQLVRTYLFIFLLSVVGSISMHYYLSKKYTPKKSPNYQIILLSILYGFFPYYINFILPGHFLLLLLPAFFPTIQLLFEKIISTSKDNFKLTLKYFSILSFILLFLCTPFANLGVLGVFYCLMVGQLVIYLVLGQINLKQLFASFFLFSLSLFISNIWWLAPYSVSMGNVSAMVEQSKQTIGSAIGTATIHSNVINIISGFPEGISISPILPILQIFILIFVVLSLFSALVNKQKIKAELLLIILITIYFTKGPNAPFNSVFDFLYHNISFLQVIRRPASKLYWIIIFFFISFLAGAINNNKNKALSAIINVTLYVTVVLSVYVTIQNTALIPFNIPSTYYSANRYLIDNNVQKILLLPDIGGLNPDYNQEINYHKGIDFLGQIWEFKKYIPSSTAWNLVDQETILVNKLAESIYKGTDFCDISKQLNVSHIVIRKDLLATNFDADLLNKAGSNLKKSKLISEIKTFGNSFRTFSVINKCVSEIIETDTTSQIQYKKNNPTLYHIIVKTSSESTSLVFREKFDKSWMLHIGRKNPFNFDSLPFHNQVEGYANGWTINIPSFCKQNPKQCQEKEGIFQVNLWIEYWPQRLFCLGLFVSSCFYILCLGYLIYHHKKIDNVKKAK